MRNLMIEGATRKNVGAGQGYRGIAIRDELIDDPVNGPSTPQMVMAYELMPDELARLNAGAPILLSILGRIPPPHLIEVAALRGESAALERVVTPAMIDAAIAALPEQLRRVAGQKNAITRQWIADALQAAMNERARPLRLR